MVLEKALKVSFCFQNGQAANQPKGDIEQNPFNDIEMTKWYSPIIFYLGHATSDWSNFGIVNLSSTWQPIPCPP